MTVSRRRSRYTLDRVDFLNDDFSGAMFREVDFSRARMRGVLLSDADIDGAIDGLRVNGVLVEPLVEAELDRLHPVRVTLRAADLGSVAAARDLWAPTIAGAAGREHVQVDGEWSLVQTLRHLIFVTDTWFTQAVLGKADFHPWGLTAGFGNSAAIGLDSTASPTLAEVLAIRDDRLGRIGAFLATNPDLTRVHGPFGADDTLPPPRAREAGYCLRVIFMEEWAHHEFAARDLATLASGFPTAS